MAAQGVKPQSVDSRDLPAWPASVPLARTFVRGRLTTLGLHHLVGDAETIIAEPATNAVVHRPKKVLTLDRMTVFCGRRSKGLVLGVLDYIPEVPRLPLKDDLIGMFTEDGLSRETGRGLCLIRMLSNEMWVERLTPGPGKWVCALIRLPA
ncbi:ATP-binding protein [Thermomonospora curvata]|uniref:Putative anti-sigma regulatory factor, serine/threonine protein kinase n=1 Tax=Thermomonospora curvata (strain ATCC 19995 / DSM 43183 / JCM 3096 / KCTC 9072 / NBRC 15933 / NCIMB 10081 / Henssen B9) TaxID=471852 RepID=D1A4N3_THECD|nr:ATP-binding protein [Thermomonospora curvata]ACY96268.1 putative anti-sigma regulatory factor, serine/threonine protein kinase [Thermomonospora curvata DSM 43183]